MLHQGEPEEITFRRTFTPTAVDKGRQATKQLPMNGRELALARLSRKPATLPKSDALTITYEDFLNHLQYGRNRYYEEVYDYVDGIPMYVGPNEGSAVSWIVPNLENYNLEVETVLEQLAPEDTDWYEDADGEFLVSTHAFKTPTNTVEYLLLSEDEEALSYIGRADAEFDYLGEFVQSSLPLVAGGDQFGGPIIPSPIPCDEVEDGLCDEFPGAVELEPAQVFTPVSSGTLTTPEGKIVPAIKVLNEEYLDVYDADDEYLGSFYQLRIIFYSKDGEYLVGDLALPENTTYEEDIEYMKSANVVFSDVYYQSLEALSLPVTWQTISASVLPKGKVAVAWTISATENNAGFTVERGDEEGNFMAIGEIADHGVDVPYTFTDADAPAGLNYYRILQTDFDGTKSYSDVVTVLITETNGGEQLVVLYPNPGTDELNFSRAAAYELFSVDGKVLASGTAEGAVNVSDLPAGRYLVRIDGGETMSWTKR